MKRTISARADGAICIGREAVPVGVFLIKYRTSAIPHNITLFVELEITIVPESIRGLFIDQRSKVLLLLIERVSLTEQPQLKKNQEARSHNLSQPPMGRDETVSSDCLTIALASAQLYKSGCMHL